MATRWSPLRGENGKQELSATEWGMERQILGYEKMEPQGFRYGGVEPQGLGCGDLGGGGDFDIKYKNYLNAI
jgi:hypothetical protein